MVKNKFQVLLVSNNLPVKYVMGHRILSFLCTKSYRSSTCIDSAARNGHVGIGIYRTDIPVSSTTVASTDMFTNELLAIDMALAQLLFLSASPDTQACDRSYRLSGSTESIVRPYNTQPKIPSQENYRQSRQLLNEKSINIVQATMVTWSRKDSGEYGSLCIG